MKVVQKWQDSQSSQIPRMSFVQPTKISFNISYAALNGSTPGGLSIVYEVVFRGWNDTELEGDRSSQLKALTIAEGDQTEGWIEIFLYSVIFKTHYSCVRSFVYEACWLNLIFISWSLKKNAKKVVLFRPCRIFLFRHVLLLWEHDILSG